MYILLCLCCYHADIDGLSHSEVARKMLDSLKRFFTHNVVASLKVVKIAILKNSVHKMFRDYAKTNGIIAPATDSGWIRSL